MNLYSNYINRLKNLKKDKLYYTKNAAFGIEGIGYTDEAPGLGKTTLANIIANEFTS